MIKFLSLIGLLLTGYVFYQSPCYLTIGLVVLVFALTVGIFSTKK